MMCTSLLLSAQQGAPSQLPKPNMLTSMLPFVLMIVIFYVLLIMPQRKKQKKHQEMVNNLKPGDRIITSGGIFGTVMGVQPDRIELKIAANVKIDITKSAIGAILGGERTEKAEKE